MPNEPAIFKIDRKKRLEWNEKKMAESAKAISDCLKDIHEKELWKDDFPSFEAYCKERLGLTRQRAYQIIGAQNVRALLLGKCEDEETKREVSTMNDRQAAQLGGIEPEKALEVFKSAKVNGKRTAETIRITLEKSETVPEAALPAPGETVTTQTPHTCPTCGQTIK